FLDEVEEVCSRVVILHRGTVIAEGTVAEIIRRAAPTTSRFRVPPELRDKARLALTAAAGVTGVVLDAGEGAALTATFDLDWLDRHPTTGRNSAIPAPVDARVPIPPSQLPPRPPTH